ncbi:hypothetical protein GH714_011131 [Hevea brasiliensis]|uniref:CCHC-type domain-containing protein n=1 Tax=Hevea brasiliensis TaxID=3981 RepID=A0A6A6L221_HEVBR|nr:hypothetical protein GH714_011131 [Hevea brasiliensis]
MPPKIAANKGRCVNRGRGTRRIRLSDVGRPHRDPAVPLLPLEEVADHDELHKGRDEHSDSASHGIVSGVYVAPTPPHPPVPTIAPPVPPTVAPPIPLVAPPIPPTTPPVPPVVTTLILSIVPTIPFQLNPDLGAFVAQVVTTAVTAKPRDPWEVVERTRCLGAYDFDSSLDADAAKKWLGMIIKGLHVEIRASMTWLRANNFRELVEATLNVEKVKQEEKEYEQKLSKKHGQGSSKAFGRDQLRKEVVHFSLGRSLVAVGDSFGLNQKKRSHPQCVACGKHHEGECRKFDIGCFECGDPGHLKRNCPLLIAKNSVFGQGSIAPGSVQIGTTPPRGRSTTDTGSSMSKASGATSTVQSRPVTQFGRPRTQARVFAMTQ